MIKRAAFLRTLAGGGALAIPGFARAESAAERTVYDALDAAIDAQFECDFAGLARLIHPGTLKLLRDWTAFAWDHLLKSYTVEDISLVTGLAAHPNDLRLSDAAVFIKVCETEKERHPSFVGDPKLLPLKVHGTIFDDNGDCHVLYSYSRAARSERTYFDYEQPHLMSMRPQEASWKISSCVLIQTVISDWWRDLANIKEIKREESGEK